MWYEVVGDVMNYRIHAANRFDAWWCAITETKYGMTKNRIIHTIREA